MADNVHPVVELLAARMESHPEEFKFHSGSSLAITGRWETWINQLGWYLSEDEKELIYGKAKELIFQRVHEEVLDELLNGPERRAQEKRERDLEMQRMMAQSQQAAMQQASHLYGQAALQPGQYAQVQSLSTLQGMGIGNVAPSQPLVIQSGGKEAMRIQANGDIKIGNETLNEGLLKSIKGKLGL